MAVVTICSDFGSIQGGVVDTLRSAKLHANSLYLCFLPPGSESCLSGSECPHFHKRQTLLVVWWLRLHATTAGDSAMIPGLELRSHMLSSAAKRKTITKKHCSLPSECSWVWPG